MWWKKWTIYYMDLLSIQWSFFWGQFVKIGRLYTRLNFACIYLIQLFAYHQIVCHDSKGSTLDIIQLCGKQGSMDFIQKIPKHPGCVFVFLCINCAIQRSFLKTPPYPFLIASQLPRSCNFSLLWYKSFFLFSSVFNMNNIQERISFSA